MLTNNVTTQLVTARAKETYIVDSTIHTVQWMMEVTFDSVFTTIMDEGVKDTGFAGVKSG